MASSSADAHSQPRRTPPMARQHSSNSQVSQSPSESIQHKASKAPRQHVVGGGRMQRNQSSKNLTKVTKLAQGHQGHQGHQGEANAVKHHRRSQSGNSVSAPSSPRPSFKRNASSGGIARVVNQGHAHANIRKNHSSGHLPHKAKPALKSTKGDIAPPKRSLVNPGKARSPSPEHPTVHFDVADEEGQDDGWTEESASQSPNTTRSNTRSNSMILDSQRMAEGAPQKHAGEAQQVSPNPSQTHASSSPNLQTLPERTHHPRQTNGGSSHHSRPPDADIITSRLLQRSSQHNAPTPPQMSSTVATVISNHNEVRELSQSAGSTLVDMPGRDLVSRFMDGEGSAGTTNNSSFLPSRNSPQTATIDMDRMKRNKSMPNVADADAEPDPPTPTKAHPRRSGTSTPTNLPPSRTQQKLMLQRASSNIEPQKSVPAILPRMGGPTFLHTGMTYTTNGEGRLDPRLQQQFNHVAVEYNVVRRYRHPLADAIIRIEQIPGTPRKTRVPRTGGANGYVNVHGSSSLSTSFHDETEGRRSRVSFENARDGRGDGDVEGRQSFESDNGRVRNEAEEICRRLWESIEAVEGD
ncbi:hypothetical protein CC80DRAFT_137334 [Byssothecium circinans]|uniref:TORC1 subunit TCO89 domain-containing protein n=1 Tax=Byssothecium circinans TaxID=147558 RepID=A0A6A5TPU4_9PLEO|nr:hypothetical protein CC80DRAFT_137334 [Byssothecium circinans]